MSYKVMKLLSCEVMAHVETPERKRFVSFVYFAIPAEDEVSSEVLKKIALQKLNAKGFRVIKILGVNSDLSDELYLVVESKPKSLWEKIKAFF